MFYLTEFRNALCIVDRRTLANLLVSAKVQVRLNIKCSFYVGTRHAVSFENLKLSAAVRF